MPEKRWTFAEIEALYRQLNPQGACHEGKKVVVAEDNPPMRNLVCSALGKRGFEVFSAENGLQALKLIRQHRPDCCILDLMLPQIGGLDILEAMRKDENYAHIPVVIMTARKEKRDVIVAQQLGVSAYLIKPFAIEELIKRVEDACGAKPS